MTKPEIQNNRRTNSAQAGVRAKFLTGSIMRHILVMASTNGLGLIGIFLVDLADLFFLSMLGDDDIIAGVGFAGALSFFTVSLSIGFSISVAALASRMIGQYNLKQAQRYILNVSLLALLLTALLAVVIWLTLSPLLSLLGAHGNALDIGINYLQIVLLSLPVMAVGMALSSAVRAAGDARLAMYISLIGGAINAILDPLFIFGLGLGVEGAAIATLLGRVAACGLALWGVHSKHRLLTRFKFADLIEDLKPIFVIAGPAMLTNMVTPIGNAIVIASVARFGAAYVAGFSVISRVAPVVFALVFGLSGAVAPIIGQNYGGRMFGRIRQALRDALLFNAVYVTLVSAILFFLQGTVIQVFNLEGKAAELMQIFCTWVAITYMFNGAQFIANASFNNLGKPIYATWFNVGRATLGTVPFVIIGGKLGGAPGVLIGNSIGSMLSATAAVLVAFSHARGLEQQSQRLQQRQLANSNCDL